VLFSLFCSIRAAQQLGFCGLKFQCIIVVYIFDFHKMLGFLSSPFIY